METSTKKPTPEPEPEPETPNNSPVKIDNKDKEILRLLNENARLTSKSIGASINISREVADYRIKRLMKNGLISGYVGGRTDRILSTLTDSFIVVPRLPILILISFALKTRMSLLTTVLMLAVMDWAWQNSSQQTHSGVC